MKRVPSSVTAPAESFLRAHRDFFVGLFVLVPVITIVVVVSYTLSKDQMFQQWRSLRVRYESSYGLSRGSAVTISGIRVGFVDEVILLDNGLAEVRFRIQQDKAHMVRGDSKAILTQENPPVGDWAIALTMGDTLLPPALDGEYLTAELPFRIDHLIGQVTSMVVSVERILYEIAEGNGIVGHVLRDDELVRDVKSVVSGAVALVQEAHATIRTADRELEAYGRLAQASSVTLDTINQAVGSIAPLVEQTDTLVRTVSTAAAGLPAVIGQLEADLVEAHTLLRGLQEHPLLRRSVRRARAREKSDAGEQSEDGR